MAKVTRGDVDDLRFIKDTVDYAEDMWFQKGQRDCVSEKHSTEVPEGLTFANAYLWLSGWYNAKFAIINKTKLEMVESILLAPDVSYNKIANQTPAPPAEGTKE